MGTNEGTVKARSVRRKPWSSRWNLEDINNIKGAPWGPVPGDEEEEVPTVIRLGDETIIPQRRRRQEGEEHKPNRLTSRARILRNTVPQPVALDVGLFG